MGWIWDHWPAEKRLQQRQHTARKRKLGCAREVQLEICRFTVSDLYREYNFQVLTWAQ